MKTVMVTGASGALGRAVVTRLLQQPDYDVVCTARHGDDANVPLDMRSPASISAAVNRIRPDLIIHLAATLANDFEEAFEVNVEGSRHLLDAVRASRCGARVVLAGSAAE